MAAFLVQTHQRKSVVLADVRAFLAAEVMNETPRGQRAKKRQSESSGSEAGQERQVRMMARLRRMQADDGFTLIELLIVIVILGILAAVVVFAVSGISNKGTSAACQADKNSVASAAEAYYAQNGSYPASISQLVPGFLHSTPAGPPTSTYTVTLGTSGTVTSNGC